MRQALLPATAVPTLKRGLALLGYYVGEVGSEVTPALLTALCRFQYNRQIYPSGILCPLSLLAYNEDLKHAQEFSQRTDALAYAIPWSPKPVRRSALRKQPVVRSALSPRYLTHPGSPRSVHLRADATVAFNKLQTFCHAHGFVLPLATSAAFLPARRLLPSSGVPYYSLRPAGLSWSFDVHSLWNDPRKDPIVVTENPISPGTFKLWGRSSNNLPRRILRAVWLERWVSTSGVPYPLLVSGDVEGPFIDLSEAMGRFGFASPPPAPYYGSGSVLPLYGGMHEVIFQKGLHKSTLGDALLSVQSPEDAALHPHWGLAENLPLPWVFPWAYTFP